MHLTRKRSALLGAGILLFGVAGLALLISLRPEPPREERPVVSPLVTTAVAAATDRAIFVAGTGTVLPTREVALIAETSGKVVSASPAFVSGGTFREGELLVQIDPVDYENAVAVAEAEVTQRRVELLRAREEADMALAEWERMKNRTGNGSPPQSELGSLVLREPQLRLAEALLKGAEARLSDARNRLERTRVVAPFNGRVRSESADVGQFVAPGQQLGVVYSTDEVEVPVPLTTADASLIDGLWGTPGSRRIPAKIHADFGGTRYSWEGYVHRAEGVVDAGTRTISVAVRVTDPYRSGSGSRPPLLIGTFATVEIQAKSGKSVVAIPRSALRDSAVWAVEDGRLRVRPVTVLYEEENSVLLSDGLTGGEQVVTSALAIMTDGMAVRTAR